MQQITEVPKLKERPVNAHKGDFGRVCVVAGSLGMSGAAVLAGRAALRSGAGLVRLAVAQGILPIVASMEPSFTTIALAEDRAGRISARAVGAVLDAAGDNDVTAFGPGVGVSGQVRTVLAALLERDIELVIDADGLNNLAVMKDWQGKVRANLILTPHPGEMKRLWQSLFREPLPAERSEQAMKLAKLTNSVVVLKGASTVVSDSQHFYINSTGNPGMATGGSGDVLTGVIAALTAQGMSRFDAAVLGVHVHGLAGDIAAGEIGHISLIATDIIEALSSAFLKLR